ncbi:MAG TPA: DUF4209 domain-containing protein [Chthonomonadaceae bacterium]|nr:DUF4209 domain-containing protein [Chthonomonadaceae bacterium]
MVAVHLLIPQIEDSFRYLLPRMRVITSALGDDGIQDDYNLNRLLTTAEYAGPLSETFGEDMVFDLRGLLVERFGSNLRNDLAHGLMDFDSFYSFAACYFWWLALRLYALPIVAGKLEDEETSAHSGD